MSHAKATKRRSRRVTGATSQCRACDLPPVATPIYWTGSLANYKCPACGQTWSIRFGGQRG